MQRNQCSSGCALLLAHLADHGNSMVPGDKTCPRHQLPPLAWPMSFLLMKLSVTRTTCSFSFFLHRSVSLCLYPFSSFSPSFSVFVHFLLRIFVSFSKSSPEGGARPAGGTSRLRESLLRVITRNLERNVFSFDTCTDMLQIFSDYFTTLRNLAPSLPSCRIASFFFFFLFFLYFSLQRGAPFF